MGDLALLRRVKDRIDREYAEPLDVASLAGGVHMSAGHLSRQFKAAYGESPYSYLMTRRIERATALLRLGELSITDVCFTVGFSSLSTFSARFAELIGMPPSVYRRQSGLSTLGIPPCVAKQVTRPVRNREASQAARPHLIDSINRPTRNEDMKTMTCRQLGGPCDLELRGETADAVIKLQDQHLKGAVAGGDVAHEEALKAMKGRWRHPIKSMGWYKDTKAAFAALPDD